MNSIELYLLGRRLMKIAEESMPAGDDDLPASVRSVLLDVVAHPNSSIGEIVERTGFPQSHVSASVARLRAIAAALETVPDPDDKRRTLVRPAPGTVRRAAQRVAGPIDTAVASALGTSDPRAARALIADLESIAQRLTPRTLARLRAVGPPTGG
jgi:DNA-binding MarR family transcriptional regulator